MREAPARRKPGEWSSARTHPGSPGDAHPVDGSFETMNYGRRKMAQTGESCLSAVEQEQTKELISEHREARAASLLGADVRSMWRAAAGFPMRRTTLARIRERLSKLSEAARGRNLEAAAKAAIKAAGGSPGDAARQLGIKPSHLLIDAALGELPPASFDTLERALLPVREE